MVDITSYIGVEDVLSGLHTRTRAIPYFCFGVLGADIEVKVVVVVGSLFWGAINCMSLSRGDGSDDGVPIMARASGSLKPSLLSSLHWVQVWDGRYQSGRGSLGPGGTCRRRRRSGT